jgi:hypothetical protein
METGLHGLGLAEIKSEGAPTPWADAPPRPQPSWLSRKTEWPRRKLARVLERLADWICRDRDEGW